MNDIKQKLINFPRREIIWKEKKKLKKFFRANLKILKYFDDNPDIFDTDFPAKSGFYKNGIGYRGIGKGGGFTSGFHSKDTLSSKKTTNDHIIGATTVGQYVHIILKDNQHNIDWMVEEWLYENLYLWATIKVTKEEHKPENIKRSINIKNIKKTVEEKSNLDHYTENVSKIDGLK